MALPATPSVLAPETAERLAQAWVAAWNSHEIEAILAHYADDVEFTSRVVLALGMDPSGTVRGKAALRAVFEKGLSVYRDLEFKLFKVMIGVNGIAIHYQGIRGVPVVEVHEYDRHGRITKAVVHHADLQA